MVKRQVKPATKVQLMANLKHSAQSASCQRQRELEDQYYFEDSLTEKNAQQPQEPQQNQPVSQRKIKKQRKSKRHNPDDRFLREHEKKYYLFPFIYSTQNAFLKISWGQWKPNSVYKKMAAILSSSPEIPSKTPVQCKSYDQRMKEEHFIKRPEDKRQDLFQSALAYLQKQALSENDIEMIKKYLDKMAQKSSYMFFLEQLIEVEEINIQQRKFELEIKREETNLTEESKENEILFNEFFDQF